MVPLSDPDEFPLGTYRGAVAEPICLSSGFRPLQGTVATFPYQFANKKPIAGNCIETSCALLSRRQDMPVEITNSLGMKFVKIPGGTYMMGCSPGDTACDSDEKPAESKTVGDFFIATTEVTQGQWQKVMGKNPSSFKNCGDDCPVEKVSWHDAQEFIKKLNTLTKQNYRLPTEAEWEYAARGGTKTAYSWGTEMDGNHAWYDNNSGSKTHPVAKKKANPYGLYDMIGNIWEWTSTKTGSNRVFRGCSWYPYASLYTTNSIHRA